MESKHETQLDVKQNEKATHPNSVAMYFRLLLRSLCSNKGFKSQGALAIPPQCNPPLALPYSFRIASMLVWTLHVRLGNGS